MTSCDDSNGPKAQILLTTEVKDAPEEIAVALIAHEIAHAWLGHGPPLDDDLTQREADEEATSWGFDIAGYRHWEERLRAEGDRGALGLVDPELREAIKRLEAQEREELRAVLR